jgi:hypothetical protein
MRDGLERDWGIGCGGWPDGRNAGGSSGRRKPSGKIITKNDPIQEKYSVTGNDSGGIVSAFFTGFIYLYRSVELIIIRKRHLSNRQYPVIFPEIAGREMRI